MSEISGQTVTIDREHFETILRRAKFNPDDLVSPVVSISQSEVDGLRQIANKYANLTQNLMRGGVGKETIDLLSQDDATVELLEAHSTPIQRERTLHHGLSQDRPQRLFGAPRDTKTHTSKPTSYARVDQQSVCDWGDVDVPEEDGSASGGISGGYSRNQVHNEEVSTRPSYERQCARTLVLSNLAEGTTHGDITEAVRGGQLLDIYLRSVDRLATVSFLQAADARAFFNHVRRYDLYIKQKRVDVRWSDRHFFLPGHVASKIGLGATRNLVVRRCDPRLTQDTIRDDLEHIHNLVVIKVEFKGGSCYIRTNSVHNAMFARTCMMSRARYKGSKIEWDVDECSRPLGRPIRSCLERDHVSAKKANGNSMTNRFHLLDLDDEGEDEVLPAIGSKKTVETAA